MPPSHKPTDQPQRKRTKTDHDPVTAPDNSVNQMISDRDFSDVLPKELYDIPVSSAPAPAPAASAKDEKKKKKETFKF